MAINNINNGLPKNPVDNGKVSQQNQTQQAQQQAASKTATAAPAPRQDSVSLTQSAQQLNQVQKKGTEAPVNQEKVDRLKKAIQSGDYQINPEVLANKIAKAEAEIFGSK
ncbi:MULTISPECIES: flagellar biosynthesis anti-sigma factor FlgM [Alteromonas]|jgi:negative regulator of flagellin synthesis FlgM|uniref:Negative regulator of flagellin synthesis n=1 Tax=Alteromonas hispanica TaxID=315421 RepID=A0A6L9MRW2_9ALTE|nr:MULTISPECIES: flagellar biosynthesis anti-sigma factor FlgM [Alteromonas]APE06057.1 flagellar biosynthesis anti-sigma factor FlgM [Alteromonas sp. RW2A1]AUC87612.1 flagellar biosynthesis anti-sigma factor FlgM [Alteromonas sp. MB-3u-76]MAI64270.1 flagellar biosynthesis anti-sigma factor FlgM [Alteromonas sp.]NDW20621.1 flagellar biosynthesis anti-sigma factor FlgM [Alteromonas hispanica]